MKAPAAREILWFSLMFGGGFPVAWASSIDALPEGCATNCVEPYGRLLGTAPGEVAAFSNCNAGCLVREPNTWQGTFTGIKWQCVEFARRWLLVNRGVVFGDVGYAIDIWNSIEHYTRVADGVALPVSSHLNGSDVAPQVGDLLVYAKVLFGTGHVAVVTDVDVHTGTVEVGEQNYRNSPWGGDHARRVELVVRDGRHWLLDPYLIGWKRQKQ
jgi:glutathionylspermidine amidase/synthetase